MTPVNISFDWRHECRLYYDPSHSRIHLLTLIMPLLHPYLGYFVKAHNAPSTVDKTANCIFKKVVHPKKYLPAWSGCFSGFFEPQADPIAAPLPDRTDPGPIWQDY